jgi:hypothetical protein
VSLIQYKPAYAIFDEVTGEMIIDHKTDIFGYRARKETEFPEILAKYVNSEVLMLRATAHDKRRERNVCNVIIDEMDMSLSS